MIKRLLLLFSVLGMLTARSTAGTAAERRLGPSDNSTTYLPLLVRTQLTEWIGPDGGLISAIVIDPQNPGNVFAGSWGGGVYKSSDGGASWKRASQGLANLVVVSMAIDPANPATLYAGTYKGKVYKSTDSGATWIYSSEGIQDQAIVYSIVINPLNTQQVFAATRGVSNNNNQPWAGVVYRSDDGGTSWFPSLYNLGGSGYQDYVYALEINPNYPNIIFAATHEHGPVRSKNYGTTWSVLTNGITDQSTRAVVVDPRPSDARTVYTGVWKSTGVFKSNNDGDTWVLKSNGITGAHIYGLAINPITPSTLYAATYNMGVMKTSNGGNNWSAAGLSHVGIATLRHSPVAAQTVYAGTAGDGLYLSTDGGQAWNHSQVHLSATTVTGLIVSPHEPNIYYASLDGDGVMYSQDGAQSWYDFNTNLPDQIIHALVKHPAENTIFALTDSAGLYRCNIDAPGTCWQQAGLEVARTSNKEGIPEAARWDESRQTFLSTYGETDEESQEPEQLTSASLLTMEFAPSNPNIVYVGTDGAGVYRSIDGGVSWAPTGWTSQSIVGLAVHPSDPDIVYAASTQTGVIRTSPDGGATWQDINLAGLEIYALAISPAQANFLLAGTSNGVYQLDGGNWSPIGLVGQAVLSLRVHPNRPGLFVAGTTSGAWLSPDSGGSWLPGPGELSGVKIQSISFSPHDPGLIFYNTLASGTLRAGIPY